MREAFALKSFRSYPGICLEGLFLVSILPASYAVRTGKWLFLLPTAFCVISLAVWVLYNFMCGVYCDCKRKETDRRETRIITWALMSRQEGARIITWTMMSQPECIRITTWALMSRQEGTRIIMQS